MNPTLKRIKRCVIENRVRFTYKAGVEMLRDGLTERPVLESILDADDFAKIIRSRALTKGKARELLYVIKSFSYDGDYIYTKGKLNEERGEDVFYVLISAKLVMEE